MPRCTLENDEILTECQVRGQAKWHPFSLIYMTLLCQRISYRWIAGISEHHVIIMCRDSFMYLAWLIHVCDMTHPYMCHVSVIYVTSLVCAHIWMSHVTYMNESCQIHEWVMTHIWLRHEPWLSHLWHVTYTNESSFMWHKCVIIYVICDVTFVTQMEKLSHTWIYVTPLVNLCHTGGQRESPNMTQSYICHDSSMYLAWLIHICDMTHQ